MSACSVLYGVKMNKKWIIVGGVAAVLLIGITLYVLLGGREKKGPQQPFHPENWDQALPSSKSEIEDALSMFDDQEQPSYEELMKGLQNGKIRFVWELWRLRRACPENMDRLTCNMRILVYLKEKYGSPNGDKLVSLIKQYLKYEDIMLGFTWPEGIGMQERYALMKKKRREAMSPEEVALLFGSEEASMELSEKTRNFLKDTAGQPGEVRIKAYEAMVKQTMGPYYQAYMDDTPSFNRYEMEMSLRDADLAKVSPEQQTAMTRSVRERYFGKDGADRMAAVEKELAAGEQSEKAYEEAEKKFLAENASMPPDQKEAALSDMRVKFMGKEEAQAYARRREYEATMKKMGLTP